MTSDAGQDDEARNVIVDSSGNTWLTGYAIRPGSFLEDRLMIDYGPASPQLW